jgi:RNA polymerase sigma factor (sigma-70 family)
VDTPHLPTERAASPSDPGRSTGDAGPGGEADHGSFLESAYVLHRASLLRYLTTLTHDPDAAEDLCQESYARLHGALARGCVPDDAGAWLRHVGRNLAVSRARRAQVAQRYAPRLHETGSFDPTAHLAIEHELIDHIRAALGRVSEEQRQLLVLAASGFTGSQLGERLGATPGTVRTRLHRARRQLLDELEPEVKAVG